MHALLIKVGAFGVVIAEEVDIGREILLRCGLREEVSAFRLRLAKRGGQPESPPLSPDY